jgi:hypothetical protein
MEVQTSCQKETKGFSEKRPVYIRLKRLDNYA